MTRLPTPDQHAYMLSVGERKYTQAQIAELAFKSYLLVGRDFDAGYENWKRLMWPSDYTKKDWLFLALFYLSEVADEQIKEAHKDDLECIKEAVREDSTWETTKTP